MARGARTEVERKFSQLLNSQFYKLNFHASTRSCAPHSTAFPSHFLSEIMKNESIKSFNTMNIQWELLFIPSGVNVTENICCLWFVGDAN